MNEQIQKMLVELLDSNEQILKMSGPRTTPSEEVLGQINNHACDVYLFAKNLERLLTESAWLVKS